MSNSCEEEPTKKRMKLSSSSSSPPCELSSLPEEIVLSCLARVSRLDHSSLSLVSKLHRSLLVSPDLFYFRSLIGCTENCIYLCLRIPPDPNPRWFMFFPKTLDRPCRLVPIRSHFYQPPEVSSVVAHGFGIYVIGGRIGGRSSSSVLFLDCRSHTWITLPPMGVARCNAAAGVVDGKIYVLGGCEDGDSIKWGEVFDPKTQTWEALSMPPKRTKYLYGLRFPVMNDSVVIEHEKKVFALNLAGEGLFYKPSEGKWEKGNKDFSGTKRSWYVIENVVYCCTVGGIILWCEPGELEPGEAEVIKWREVMGLDAMKNSLGAFRLVNYGGVILDHYEEVKREGIMPGLPENIDDILPGHKLSNSGSNMLIFWDVLGHESLEIWCAEITLEKRKEKGEIWGNIMWKEAVMTFDPPPPHQGCCKILYSLSLNL